jgi:Fic family protein
MNAYQQTVEMWRGFKIETEADLATHLDSFCILFAYNSNKIENGNTTYDDTYEVFVNGRVTGYTGDTRTITEIENQKRAWLKTLQAFGRREPIDEAFVLEMQRIITEGTYDETRTAKGERPGKYKRHHYVVGRSETGAAPETVIDEMAELLDEMAGFETSDNNLLTAAAYFHAKFENIHPFSDGNGRAGRTMMNYYLLLNDHPPITIHDEDRKDYYAVLEAYHFDLDLEPLKGFLREQTVKTWEKTLARERKRSNRDLER